MNQTNSYAYLVAPFLGWAVAQTIKLILTFRKDGITWHDAIQSGGMPSSHTAFMTALTTAIGIGVGFDSVAFAVTLALTSIVVYDAAGVRRTTGEQTDAIIKIAKKTGSKVSIKHDARGHQPAEVIGGIIIGILVGVLTSYFL